MYAGSAYQYPTAGYQQQQQYYQQQPYYSGTYVQQQQPYPVTVQPQQQQQQYVQPQPQSQPVPPASTKIATSLKKSESTSRPSPKEPVTVQPPRKMADLLKGGKLAIKPFAPDRMDEINDSYTLTLGSNYYRAKSAHGLANPYHPYGFHNGMSDTWSAASEWEKVREGLIKSLVTKKKKDQEEAEEILDDIYPPSDFRPDDLAIVLDPLESVVCHAKETLIVPKDSRIHLEPCIHLARASIDVRINHTHSASGRPYKPSFVITNTSIRSTTVLFVDRPVANVTLMRCYFDDDSNPKQKALTITQRIKNMATQIRDYNACVWNPALMLNIVADSANQDVDEDEPLNTPVVPPVKRRLASRK